jgi:glycyl-tRNA synthetase alpha chain
MGKPHLGAWGLGWEVWLDGMEITSSHISSSVGGFDCKRSAWRSPTASKRIAMLLQGVDSVYNLTWIPGVTYGDVYHQNEVEQSTYNFQVSDAAMLFNLFNQYEAECKSCLEKKLPLPAYDYCLKCSHTFNLLDARGAISVTERVGYIQRVRDLARGCAVGWLKAREALGFPW